MNKKFIISVLVVFVLAMGLSFLFHGYMLAPSYAALEQHVPTGKG